MAQSWRTQAGAYEKLTDQRVLCVRVVTGISTEPFAPVRVGAVFPSTFAFTVSPA